ncbi:MAG: hypothetical protein ACLQVD_22970 [Capsulimonadaceae bacterium]
MVLLMAAATGYGIGRTASPPPPAIGTALTANQAGVVTAAIALMSRCGLVGDAALASNLLQRGIWKAARPDDPFLSASEKSGDTPYAYTLPHDKSPTAIVLGPRFFVEATPIGQAALMLHEMGHYRAFVRTGMSTETDGYKAEFDTHGRIGLTERDGLVYFSMLDGVVQYVVPEFPVYKQNPEVKAYMAMSQ